MPRSQPGSLRERNRLNAMRLTQRTALDLFDEHGFEAVTVQQIASEVGMAPSTLYRHFETKEAILLWDEHDEGIEQALERELARKPPFDALRTAFVDELGGRYDDDLEFQLRRVRFIYATEAVHAAALEAEYADTAALAAGLEQVLATSNRRAAAVMAGAAMIAIDVALDRWQEASGATPLGSLIDEAFGALAHLEALQ